MHIILGGTSGLGLEMARQLKENGKRVLALGKTHNAQEHGEGFSLDMYYPEQVAAAPARIEQILGGDEVKFVDPEELLLQKSEVDAPLRAYRAHAKWQQICNNHMTG
ncbi:hypothetical protein GWK73_01220 [Candidatus Saccharibacteria bacterium oral taxon 955]|nr:hypothetical protein GWK73_01220 [Candidatus Saccharibacteria bacterium oral taxon 955]